jgi:hypothetical protein
MKTRILLYCKVAVSHCLGVHHLHTQGIISSNALLRYVLAAEEGLSPGPINACQ